MVKLLIGHKGSGKTKRMIELANDTVQTVSFSSTRIQDLSMIWIIRSEWYAWKIFLI